MSVMKSLMVVESPAKAKTINKYLGKEYKVLASFGHIRALPKKNDSVSPNEDFNMKYDIIKTAQKHIKELVEAAKECDRLVLASDPDREGEAIAWHVVEVLQQKKVIDSKTKIDRVVFNAITRESVSKAMENPRKLDMCLVNAQQARVALDYLVGFSLSPVLWRKLPGSRSAGRVQSVALRLICERQIEISNFRPEEYWTIDVLAKTANGKDILARLTIVNGRKLDKFSIANAEEAKKLKSELEKEKYSVKSIEVREVKKNPFPPFTTSTLQQEASRKFGFSAKKTMAVAQRLYEGIDVGNGSQGLITYMRTDGVYTAPEAIAATRQLIFDNYGREYLPEKAVVHQNKIKNAQEAHEAIRPTDPTLLPKNIKNYLVGDEFKLYNLIWKRLVASQMASVILDQISIDIETSKHLLRATGSTVKFDGFHVLYNETNEDEVRDNNDSLKLPKVTMGDSLALEKVIDSRHFTEPPSRYSEASLVKKMEELGIGRPSTYANIIDVLQKRKYVKLEKKKFEAENRGLVVNTFLKIYFGKYIEYDYTAKLEDDLDIVSNGKKDWKELLKGFWFPFDEEVNRVLQIKSTEILGEITVTMNDIIFGLDSQGKLNNRCPVCENGLLNLRTSKFGIFIACSNYPSCKYTKQISNAATEDNEVDVVTGKKFENKILGESEKQNVYLKKGPYGFYIQLGEDSKTSKPRRISVPKNMGENDIDFQKAMSLLTLPKILGKHPDDEQEIRASIGPYGPYVMWNKKFYSVKKDDILKISLEKALTIINESKKSKKAESK
jgi:DNA topoisomerase-1